jgi:hypothetical protein
VTALGATKWLPIRKPGQPLHLALPTGRGYRTACGRSMSGPTLELAPAPFGRSWGLELRCEKCEQERQAARRVVKARTRR